MKCEWDRDKSEEYNRGWHHMMDTHGSMVIEYNNMQIYKKIPTHLMINLKLEEGKMWKRCDGMFVMQYNRERKKHTFNCKKEEHMDMLSGNINKTEVIYPMPKIVLDVDDVRRALGKVKKGKQPGPDKLKGEIFKSLKDSEKLVIHLTEAYNAVLEDGTVTEKWKRSRTVMISKTKKPTAKEHRPIALTNVGYKLFMGLVKDKLVQHLDRNRMISDYQAGFTGARRLEEICLLLHTA